MSRLVAVFVVVAMLLAPLAVPSLTSFSLMSVAHAQDVSGARLHYQRGNGLFSSGDYKGAIAEFAAADNLAPSAMLEFNIALCYDRLGEQREALKRYQAYLREMPNAKNRASVEAKIRRLEGSLRQTEAATIAPAPAPDVIPTPAPDVAPALPTPDVAPDVPNASEMGGEAIPDPLAARDVYTPGDVAELDPDAAAPNPAPTDPELQRVAAINVAAIRDQRAGSSAGTNSYQTEPVPPAPVADNKSNSGNKASKPIYKKWWFWAIAIVGGVIVYDLLSTDSTDSTNQRLMLPPAQTGSTATAPGGLEWRF